MSICGGSITLKNGKDVLTGLQIVVLSEHPTEGRQAPWFARWDIPQTSDALHFIEMVLTDNTIYTLVLDDGRRGHFECTYDGKALLMKGLQPFESL